jgi:hypothetical protein
MPRLQACTMACGVMEGANAHYALVETVGSATDRA